MVRNLGWRAGFGWPAGWLVGRPVGWLVGRPVGWLAGRPPGWFWLAGWPVVVVGVAVVRSGTY